MPRNPTIFLLPIHIPLAYREDSHLHPLTLNPPYAMQRAVSPNLLCVRTPFCAPSPWNLKAPLHIPQFHLTLNLADNQQWWEVKFVPFLRKLAFAIRESAQGCGCHDKRGVIVPSDALSGCRDGFQNIHTWYINLWAEKWNLLFWMNSHQKCALQVQETNDDQKPSQFFQGNRLQVPRQWNDVIWISFLDMATFRCGMYEMISATN
jgi:hypothetical protein